MQPAYHPANHPQQSEHHAQRPEGQDWSCGTLVDSGGRGEGERALDRPPTRTSALGLVSSKTSGGKDDETRMAAMSHGFLVDTQKARATRMRKSLLTSARLHVEESDKPGYRPGWWAFVTLTYRPDVRYSSRHISDVIVRLREWAKRKGVDVRYLWCLELTRRGQPHYHLMVRLPRGVMLPKPDKAGWWRHGMTNIQKARNAIGYMAKYASKCTAESMQFFPKGARSHGVGGLTGEARRELRWWKAPSFVRDALGLQADIRKILGGYVNRVTGETYESPWRIAFLGNGRIWAWRIDQS